APGGGLGPTAVAECRARGSHLAGYATQAAPDGAQAGNLRGGPLTATVDTTAGPDGATDVVSASEINDVTLGGVVTLRSIRNRAVATTTGRPGGAVAKAEATIGALLVNGKPVALPSDAIQNLGPALAGLRPVLSPAGTLTFDVVPELVEAAADGTRASARAAQITVTLHTGQLTVAFGLGYARAGARTIVNQPSPDRGTSLGGGLGGLAPPPAESAEPGPTAESPASNTALTPGGPDNVGAGVFGATGPGTAGPAPPPGGFDLGAPAPPFPSPPGLSAVPVSPTVAALAPALPPAAAATARSAGPAGPSKGTVGLLALITAALLVRYLAYSTQLRRREAAP
ncbi:MAG TPA: hypothetical protein VGP90_03080, partial [Acidimicrobiia bacterium]|nr:hypothetical protein [Acidimicrobiia bacterium]